MATATSPRRVVDALHQDVQQTLPFLQARLDAAQNTLNVEERQAALDQVHILFNDTEQLFQRLEAERDQFQSDDVDLIADSRAEFDYLSDVLRDASDRCETIVNRCREDADENESLLRATQNTMVNVDLSEALVTALQQQREAMLQVQEKNSAVQSKLGSTRYYTSRIQRIQDWLDRALKALAVILVCVIIAIVYIKWIR